MLNVGKPFRFDFIERWRAGDGEADEEDVNLRVCSPTECQCRDGLVRLSKGSIYLARNELAQINRAHADTVRTGHPGAFSAARERCQAVRIKGAKRRQSMLKYRSLWTRGCRASPKARFL